MPIAPQSTLTPTERSRAINRLIHTAERLRRLPQEGISYLNTHEEQALLEAISFHPDYIDDIATHADANPLIGVRYDGVAFTHGIRFNWVDPLTRHALPVYGLLYVDEANDVRLMLDPLSAHLPARTTRPSDKQAWSRAVDAAWKKRLSFEDVIRIKQAFYDVLLPDHEPVALPVPPKKTDPTLTP